MFTRTCLIFSRMMINSHPLQKVELLTQATTRVTRATRTYHVTKLPTCLSMATPYASSSFHLRAPSPSFPRCFSASAFRRSDDIAAPSADADADAAEALRQVLALKLRRAQQLFHASQADIENEAWETAEANLESVEELIAELRANSGDAQVEHHIDHVIVPILLGFVRFCRGNLETSLEAYERGFPALRALTRPRRRDLGTALTNYCEVLAFSSRTEEAVHHATEAVSLLDGADDEALLASAKSNLASYLATLERYEEARQPAFEALRSFEKQLGRESGYTLGALRNYYKILESLRLERECEQLREEWSAQPDALKFGVDEADMVESAEKFQQATDDWVNARKAFDPEGFLLHDDDDRRDLEAFAAKWEQEGIRIPPGMANMMRHQADKAYRGTLDVQVPTGNLDETTFPDLGQAQAQQTAFLNKRAYEAEFKQEDKDFLRVGFNLKVDKSGKPSSMDPL